MTRILAIDDRKDNLIAIGALLKQHLPDCQVITAQSGPEGIGKAKNDRPDTILLDVSMPSMDGYEVCRMLKADPQTANIPVIMITAIRVDTESQVRGYEAGADAYLGKPVDHNVLAAQVRIALRMKRAEEALKAERDQLDKNVREKTQALAASEARLRSLVEYSTDHIFALDREAKYVFSNDRVEHFGMEGGAALLGKHLTDVYPPATAEEYLSRLLRVYETGRAVVFEHRITGRNGQAYHRDTLYPILRDGKLELVGGICHDVSEIKVAELVAEENQRRLESVLRSLPGFVYTCRNTQDWPMDHVSGGFEDLTECEPADFAEKRAGVYADFIHPADREGVWQGIQSAVDRGQPFEVTYRIATVGGRQKWVWEKGQAIFGGADGENRLEGFVMDITERKQLEAQLRQAQKMDAVGRLAGGVAHDFNNMLSVVAGYTGMAMDQLEPGDPLRHDLGEVLNAAKRSTDLVRQLLAFSRKQVIEPKTLCLNELLATSLKFLGRLVGEDVHVQFIPAENAWNVRVDPGQVQQILANLAVNARDAISGVGSVVIETENKILDDAYCQAHAGFTPGEFFVLSFSDTGCGMDRSLQEKIFEPFFTTKAAGEGTGLGLSIVYGIVKQNNGFINVYSEPGLGTTIRIYLPRHAGSAEPIATSGERPVQGGTETILLVEDEEMILQLARKILDRAGYNVIACSVPGEALLLAERHGAGIHMLITDVVMPTMSGKELKEEIEKLNPGVKTLYMSGYTSNIIAQRGIVGRQTNFIQKPFSQKDLLNKIRSILD